MNLKLRALEPNDLELVYEVENDKSLWVYSNTSSPFSRHTLKKFIENSHLDIIEHKQLRLVIADDEQSYGFIDLYDYDFINRRVGLGIIIFKKYRSKGIGLSSLQLTENYLLEHVPIHQVYANISSKNKESISLFEKSGFVNIGLKKDWIFYNNKFNDELLFQKILNK
ncbi:MAG: GNAT family N-acetyltransferase [Cryomorphaceae bacterium]|jgi:diamine N-acetyltransferase|nr:GNAT family N-acetyltransferase [Cryomorphaceae bacterium]MDG1889075.1 GNAT family N-acetyltransferase [Flavobacteriaceae bacterium]MBT3503161.1 GNAT family N-acetyltransferase [Cryomorphaceae bacterium]MBT3689236.1 GNAT family N-acetyltransferase [Cryomorphaceae bacterium]MBT4222066.1 GNAT family N-acetyltransferase [Cryomorphaceae bacterium]